MQLIDEDKWDIWEAGDYTGSNAPVTRAIISKQVIQTVGQYDAANPTVGDQFRTLLFEQDGAGSTYVEIPNLVSCTIDRRLDADAASMTLVMRNQTPLDVNANLDTQHGDPSAIETGAGSVIGLAPTRRELKDLGQPGYYTYQRGLTFDSQWKWGYAQDPTWVDMFIPNRVIRTFQGYGSDGSAQVWNDTKLDQTGTWLIDRVEYSGGLITIQCRDLAKLLIEQRIYPPIVPLSRYPLEFCGDSTKIETGTQTTIYDTFESVSGDLGVHQTVGWDSGNYPYFGYNGSVYGHRPSHAFDGDESTYWLSMRNNGPNELWSFEWIEADTKGALINQVHMKVKWGGYKVWVCVNTTADDEGGEGWQGTNYVPYGYYTAPAAPNGSYKPYVKYTTVPQGDGWVTIDLPRTYAAKAVRVVFSNLQYYGVISGGDYRAAVYELEIRLYTPAGTKTVTEEVEQEVPVPGNIDDYTDIIKLLCAWSGFYWPSAGTADQLLLDWGATQGRVWGDFFYSGAYPVEPACIPPSYWDNKSVMDGINQIKEILGFIFYVDPTGGVIWRPPNIWRTGNHVWGVGYVGEDTVRDIDENRVLLDYGVTIDDQNLRSKIVVVSAQDPTLHGSYTPGFASTQGVPTAIDDLALLGGQERVMLVPNYPFISQEEVNKFGFLVSLWIHWSYRASKFRIPGVAALEPDDQIRIFERVTADTFIHYIQGYQSVMNMDSGTWYMDVDTHWLGNGPSEEWHVNMASMDPSLYAYLVAIGQIDDDNVAERPPEVDEIINWQPPEIPTDPIRIPDDWWDIYPDPISILWPEPGTDPEDGSASNEYVDPPSKSSGGSAYGCSNTTQFANWGSGPYHTKPPAAGFLDDCNRSNIVRVALAYKGQYTGQNVTQYVEIDRRAVPAFRALAALFEDYTLPMFTASGMACRAIRGGGSYNLCCWSNHAWGLAVDFNSAQFPYGKSYSANATWGTKLKQVADAAVGKIRCGNGQRVFTWGETFSTKDPMHFQVCCSPSDLATGIYLHSGGGVNQPYPT